MKCGMSVKNRYWAVMPGLKWTWLKMGVFSLYSRAGAGAVFMKAKATYTGNVVITDNPWRPDSPTEESGLTITIGKKKNTDTRTQFAFQIAPLGLEVGGRWLLLPKAVSECLAVS